MKKNVYSVSQVNSYIKNMFAQDFMMNRIYVKGEVSNCKYHPTGHIYFTLKDDGGSMRAILFAANRKGLAFSMKDGDNVVALGSIAVYERGGTYQLYAKEILLDGAGLLYQRFEALKRELEEMGMFAAEYKQPIPRYVSKVGIVTASTGAAIRDIQNIASRRNPFVQLYLYPALVQGEGAAASIVAGIKALDAFGVDVMIVGRGGGSIEDLWAFNEEAVARAVFECRTPVISAVGHETDVTIVDFVADLRAPTPSAAAELAVYEIRELLGQLNQYQLALDEAAARCITACRERVRYQQQRFALLKPEHRIQEKRQHHAELQMRLEELMEQKLTALRHRLALCAGGLEGVSPLAQLSRGYAFVTDENGSVITDASVLKPQDLLHVQFQKGSVLAGVTQVIREEPKSGQELAARPGDRKRAPAAKSDVKRNRRIKEEPDGSGDDTK